MFSYAFPTFFRCFSKFFQRFLQVPRWALKIHATTNTQHRHTAQTHRSCAAGAPQARQRRACGAFCFFKLKKKNTRSSGGRSEFQETHLFFVFFWCDRGRRSSKSPKYKNHCRGYHLQHNPHAKFCRLPVSSDLGSHHRVPTFKFSQEPRVRHRKQLKYVQGGLLESGLYSGLDFGVAAGLDSGESPVQSHAGLSPNALTGHTAS